MDVATEKYNSKKGQVAGGNRVPSGGRYRPYGPVSGQMAAEGEGESHARRANTRLGSTLITSR